MKIEKLNKVVTFVSGGVAYSLIDKLVNYRSDKAEAVLQSNRDQILKKIVTDVKKSSDHITEYFNVFKECRQAFSNRDNVVMLDKDVTLSQLNAIKSNGSIILSKNKELKSNVDWNLDRSYEELLELLKGVDDLIKKVSDNNDSLRETNNIVPCGNVFSDFYQYLESLTILQHTILLDILMFLLLILTVINILSALFGNDIIRYLKLETKFPRLSLFFKVRSSLQRYYLMWNVFVLMFVCMFGIGINIVVLVLSIT